MKTTQYKLVRPDSISKKVVLNIFRRISPSKDPKKEKLFIFLERFYQISIKIGFLSIALHSLNTKKSNQLKNQLSKLERKLTQKLFSSVMNLINQQCVFLDRTTKLEKILRKTQNKTLKGISSDCMAEFVLNIMKRVFACVSNRQKILAFTDLKNLQKRLGKLPLNFRSFLCYSIKGTVIKRARTAFDSLINCVELERKKMTAVRCLVKSFLSAEKEAWIILKCYEKIPKYFLSNQMKYNFTGFVMRSKNWKKSLVFSFVSILSKKVECLECYAFCKISASCSASNFYSPIKLCNVSTDDSSLNVTFKRIKLTDLLKNDSDREKNEKNLFSLLRFTDVIKVRVRILEKYAFSAVKLYKKQKNSLRISCKELPICRKLKVGTLSFRKENSIKSISPIGKSKPRKSLAK